MPIIEDDEVLQLFIEESREHLNGIEADLLDIEEAGEDIDDDLVNKVFRAIHSVKGGAGFLGLENIKDVSHKMENILNMIRNKELVPIPRIMTVLLSGTDKLSEMLNDPVTSNDVEIADILDRLNKSLIESLPEDEKDSVDDKIELKLPSGKILFEVSELDLNQARKSGKNLYIAEYDLLRDIERQGKKPLDVINEILSIGNLIESCIDVEAVGELEDLSSEMVISFYILISTIVEDDLISSVFRIDDSRIFKIAEDNSINNFEDPDAEPKPDPEPVVEKPKAKPEKKAPKAKEAPKKTENKPKKVVKIKETESAKKKVVSTTSLRVNVKVLDQLMNLAGELVLTRNQLVQAVISKDLEMVEMASQKVDLVTSELQESIMTTRMQPVGTVFQKFQRVVHDMSRNLGKEIELEIEGKEVELDKTIIEAIGDPMTHLVRNAVDHAIEMPDKRSEAGKPNPATIKLSAYHEAGQVIIEVTDDGAGINPDMVIKKAIENGMRTKEELDKMTSDEIVKLIFMPGFSLAKEVTDISGRGVGMDVVNSNLTKLGGTIDIFSAVGKGTTIQIKLPLTLAIIPSLIIKVEEERYAIPQVNLVELVRIAPEKIKDRIELIHNTTVMRLRGELLPLLRLSDTLGIPRTYYDDEEDFLKDDRRSNIHDRRTEGKEIATSLEEKEEDDNKRDVTERRSKFRSAVNIIVVTAGELNYGLIVDDLMDTEEIVVKPLGIHLNKAQGYAGATILGDGHSALILDIVGISKMENLKVVKEASKQDLLAEELNKRKNAQSLLIVKNGETEFFAVPLGLITRLEKVKREQLEMPGGTLSMKYRGGNMKLFTIESVANVMPREDVDNPFVIMFPIGGTDVGVVVSSIVDAIDISVEIDDTTFKQPGILGSTIIMEQTTMLLDLFGIVAVMAPELTPSAVAFEDDLSNDLEVESEPGHVLIVEDSNFFLNNMKNIIEDAGYPTVTAMDGLEGLDALHANSDKVKVILTDIEMPNMDGLEMSKKIRTDSVYDELPIIACTSVAGEMAEKRGFESGLDEYLIKLDREQVIEKVRHYMKNGRKKMAIG